MSRRVQVQCFCGLLLHKTVKRGQQRPITGWIVVDLSKRMRYRFQRRQLVRRMRLADPVARRRHVAQRQARQALQRGIQVQHLAALAPGAVQHGEPEQAGLGQQGLVQRRRRRDAQRRVAGRVGIQQDGGSAARFQQAGELGGIEGFADGQAAARQAQVQQARAVLGVAHFERMLQHEQFDGGGHGRRPAADAVALRAQAGGAGRAAMGDGRNRHGPRL